jgi:hypothetical protein
LSRANKRNHTPTPETRKQVETLAGYGLTIEQIGHVLECSHDTVRRHYGAELERGRAVACAKVTQTAFQMATSGSEPAITIFWLKTRAGWRETVRLEGGDPDHPIYVKSEPQRPQLTREEWLKHHGLDTAEGTAARGP